MHAAHSAAYRSAVLKGRKVSINYVGQILYKLLRIVAPVSRGRVYKYHALVLNTLLRAIYACSLAGSRAYVCKHMHIAAFNGNAVAGKPISYWHMARCVKHASLRRKLSGYRADRPFHKAKLDRRSVYYLLIRLTVEYLFHKRLPQRSRDLPSRRILDKLLIIVVRTYPYNRSIVASHSGKVGAAVIRVRACLSGNRHSAYFGCRACSALHGVMQYINKHVCRGRLKYLPFCAHLVSIQYHLAVLIDYPCKRYRLYICSAVCYCSICTRHLYRGYSHCAQSEARARCFNTRRIHAKLGKILCRYRHGNVFHKRSCRRHVKRRHNAPS